MINLEIISKNANQTKKLGNFLAGELLKDILKAKSSLIFACKGDLGSGKTTFIQGLAGGLGIKEKITSPTFVLLKKFSFFLKQKQYFFYHIDCYRLSSKQLSSALDLKELFKSRKTIIIIEWAEKLKKILPQDAIWINFKYLDKDERKIIFKNL